VRDAHGKIAWGRSNIGGDPIVAVLTEQVSDVRLAGLRRDGVSIHLSPASGTSIWGRQPMTAQA